MSKVTVSSGAQFANFDVIQIKYMYNKTLIHRIAVLGAKRQNLIFQISSRSCPLMMHLILAQVNSLLLNNKILILLDFNSIILHLLLLLLLQF